MAISVRMDAMLEKELELIAKRRGITKSQFIIEAVERALGHKDPYKLLLQVREETAFDKQPYVPPAAAADEPKGRVATGERVRQKLKARHAAATADWLAGRDKPTPPSSAE